ncbi:uncharacterized protein LOC134534466 [Bacillus rossius redtenbacheri]|uniref:uncharacterized protein LOC134534466 n=1 Tax=Bacillus rossius redtenbacheri TaxID=93214 RepID=UPI002FDD3010
MRVFLLVVVLAVLAAAAAEEADQTLGFPEGLRGAQESFLRLVEAMDARPSLGLVPGLATLERTKTSPEQQEQQEERATGNSTTGDPGERLAAAVARYLRTHVVELRVSPAAERVLHRVLPRGVDVVPAPEGRGRIRKLLLPLVLLLNLKSFVLVPIFLSAVVLVAFKGLWAGLAAFLVSGAIGLRQLFKGADDQGPSTRLTVGVVKPHLVPEVYHHAPDYWHGWSRSAPPPPPPPPPSSHDAYPYRGYYPQSSGAWADRPLVS